MRYTEYHNSVAVIKDKSLLKEAMAKLAKYEDGEEKSEMVYKINMHCNSTEDCDVCVLDSICDGILFAQWSLKRLKKASKMIDALNER